MADKELIQISPAEATKRNVGPEVQVCFGAGFHDQEVEAGEAFRWMPRKATLELSQEGTEALDGGRYLEIWIGSPFFDLSQTVTLSAGAAERVFTLVHGWGPFSLEIPPGAGSVDLEVSKVFPREYYPTDRRELAIRVKRPVVHREEVRHLGVLRRQANEVLNMEEMLAGKAKLESLPPSLGIDLHGVCNIKPPCVYCQWDEMKALEGQHAEEPFTRETLAGYGPFFQETAKLVNCSIGEPFMMKSLDGILDAFGEQGKTVEMSTNGQILTDKNIQKLLGRDIHLYVSLDAATPETYGRLRNDRFLRILDNLRRLVLAKGGRNGLPHLYLVFMPMRVNAHELGAFVRLSHEIGADQVILRPLDPGEGIGLKWDRGGYSFDYQNENLPFEELMRLSGKAHELCEQLGVPLSNQLDFGGKTGQKFQQLFDEGVSEAREELQGQGGEQAQEEEGGGGEAKHEGDRVEPLSNHPPSLGKEKWPICTEPWRSFYILRRGTLPCCYGGRPVAEPEGYKDAWNGPLLQAIRKHLAAGRFHSYCIRTRSCPIVQKSEAARELGPLGKIYRRLQRTFHRLDRVFGGRILRAAKWLGRSRSSLTGGIAGSGGGYGANGEGDESP